MDIRSGWTHGAVGHAGWLGLRVRVRVGHAGWLDIRGGWTCGVVRVRV